MKPTFTVLLMLAVASVACRDRGSRSAPIFRSALSQGALATPVSSIPEPQGSSGALPGLPGIFLRAARSTDLTESATAGIDLLDPHLRAGVDGAAAPRKYR